MKSVRAGFPLLGLLAAGALPLVGQDRKPPPLSELEARARKDSLDARAFYAELEQRVRVDSNDAQLHYQLGVALAKEQRTADARRALGAAVKIDPKFVNAWVALIRLTSGYKRPTLAVQLSPRGRFTLVVVQPSDSMRYMVRRVFLLDPLADVISGDRYPVPSGWETAMARGMRAFRQGDWKEAERHFGAVIKQTTRAPGKPDVTPPYALWYHALTQVEQGRYAIAIQNVERLLNTAFRDSTGYGRSEAFSHQYTLAYLHHVAGNLEEAARVYRVVLEDQMGLDLVHMRLAQVLEQMGRWDVAVAERRNAANANPDDPSLIFDLGMSLHNAGMNSEAGDVLRQALAANPREVRAHLVLGAVLQAQGRGEAARAEYERFLELSPRRYETLIADAQARLANLP